jgi:hypothetical protein
MDKIKELLAKKVFGIPMLYIVGVGVGVFAFIAWKLKPAATPADTVGTESSDNAGEDLSGVTNGDLSGSVYDGLKTAGTVVVAPNPDGVDTPNTVVKTNATWVNDGVAWLIAQDKATGTAAISALTKYVNAQDRSYDEEYLVNLWLKQGGPPPDGIDPGGTVGTKPAQRQGNPPLVHTVKGAADNSYGDLATLYYGHNEQATFDLVQSANPALGLNGPFSVGTKVSVPAYHVAKRITLTKDMSQAQIRAANGLSAYQFEALNNTTRQQFKKGESIRVS